MKVGIVTLPLDYNYGGILQAYALQTVINNLGHEAHHITKAIAVKDRLIPNPLWRKFLSYPLRFVKKYIFGQKNIIVNWESRYNETQQNLCNHTLPFIKRYIQIDEYTHYEEIPCDFYDAIVVGSDQVWRKKYFDYPDKIANAFLEFAHEWQRVKRVSYAASFGQDNVNEYDNDSIHQCSLLLKQFNAVSVREQSGILICKQTFGVDAVQVVDPTLLLNQQSYLNLIRSYSSSNGDLFYYILDETDEIVTQILKEGIANGYKPFRVNALPMNSNVPLEKRIQRPVEEWLRAFYDSKFIITDSFHACVFSIIFNKPFYVIENKRRGITRIQSLLSTYGLLDRIVSINEIGKFECNGINWIAINEKRTQLINNSLRFLNESLR